MKKDIPEIEDLIAGINDPDVTLGTTPGHQRRISFNRIITHSVRRIRFGFR